MVPNPIVSEVRIVPLEEPDDTGYFKAPPRTAKELRLLANTHRALAGMIKAGKDIPKPTMYKKCMDTSKVLDMLAEAWETKRLCTEAVVKLMLEAAKKEETK